MFRVKRRWVGSSFEHKLDLFWPNEPEVSKCRDFSSRECPNKVHWRKFLFWNWKWHREGMDQCSFKCYMRHRDNTKARHMYYRNGGLDWIEILVDLCHMLNPLTWLERF